MTPNYPEIVAETIAGLPVAKQAEVLNFAEFVRLSVASKIQPSRRQPGSVLGLFGTCKSCATDGSVNHDRYLYE